MFWIYLAPTWRPQMLQIIDSLNLPGCRARPSVDLCASLKDYSNKWTSAKTLLSDRPKRHRSCGPLSVFNTFAHGVLRPQCASKFVFGANAGVVGMLLYLSRISICSADISTRQILGACAIPGKAGTTLESRGLSVDLGFSSSM